MNYEIKSIENGFSWETSLNGNPVLTYSGTGIADLRYDRLVGTRIISTKTEPIVALVAINFVKSDKLTGKFKISAMRDLYIRVRALVNGIYQGNFSTVAWLCKHVPQLVTENKDLFTIAVSQVKGKKNRTFPTINDTDGFNHKALDILMGKFEPDERLMTLITRPREEPITDEDAEEFFG